MKNFAAIYSSSNDSIALEQRWYIKAESERGEIATPTDADFLYTLQGGSISYSQALESSAHRSGRHHVSSIKKKKETSFSFSTYFNIDETLSSASVNEIDAANRLLYKSLLGKEATSPHLKYTAELVPDITFSLFECGDKWARQSPGAFIQGGNLSFPGDGEAKAEWTGNAKEAFFVGIGKSTVSNDDGNTVTLQAGEGQYFRKGALVMLVKADGTTRSTDTPNGSSRKVVSIAGDVITLSGAPLADADGSVNPVYLSYYEPAMTVISAINNPVTGLVGSMQIAGVAVTHFRNATLNIQNNHELVDYSYGTDGLAEPYFVPGSRLTSSLTVEANLNAETIKLFNRVQDFQSQSFNLILGDSAGRHLKVTCPVVKFKIPSFSVPESGSVPVSFEGDCYASNLDSADEVALEFK